MTLTEQFVHQPLAHIGYVVEDIPKAVDFWVETYGAGPFYHVPDMHFDELTHMGQPVVIEHSCAYGACGSIGVEFQTFKFLEPMPSLEERVAGRLNRMNHIAYFEDDPVAASQRLERLGLTCFMAGRRGPDRLFWHEAGMLGHPIEIHTAAPANLEFIAAVHRAAEDWDGTDPFRESGPEGITEETRQTVMQSRTVATA